MENAPLMGVGHGVGDLKAVASGLGDGQAAVGNQEVEGPAADELHRDVGEPIRFPDVVDGAHVRMVERRRQARLAQQRFA